MLSRAHYIAETNVKEQHLLPLFLLLTLLSDLSWLSEMRYGLYV